MTVDHHKRRMALHLPFRLERRLTPNRMYPAPLARAQEVHGIAIDTLDGDSDARIHPSRRWSSPLGWNAARVTDAHHKRGYAGLDSRVAARALMPPLATAVDGPRIPDNMFDVLVAKTTTRQELCQRRT